MVVREKGDGEGIPPSSAGLISLSRLTRAGIPLRRDSGRVVLLSFPCFRVPLRPEPARFSHSREYPLSSQFPRLYSAYAPTSRKRSRRRASPPPKTPPIILDCLRRRTSTIFATNTITINRTHLQSNMPSTPPTILLFGLGGIGAVYALLLTKAGAKVHVVARSNLEQVREHGLDYESVTFGKIDGVRFAGGMNGAEI